MIINQYIKRVTLKATTRLSAGEEAMYNYQNDYEYPDVLLHDTPESIYNAMDYHNIQILVRAMTIHLIRWKLNEF